MQAEMMEKQRVEQAAMAKQVGQALRSIDIFWWDEVGPLWPSLPTHADPDEFTSSERQAS